MQEHDSLDRVQRIDEHTTLVPLSNGAPSVIDSETSWETDDQAADEQAPWTPSVTQRRRHAASTRRVQTSVIKRARRAHSRVRGVHRPRVRAHRRRASHRAAGPRSGNDPGDGGSDPPPPERARRTRYTFGFRPDDQGTDS